MYFNFTLLVKLVSTPYKLEHTNGVGACGRRHYGFYLLHNREKNKILLNKFCSLCGEFDTSTKDQQ